MSSDDAVLDQGRQRRTLGILTLPGKVDSAESARMSARLEVPTLLVEAILVVDVVQDIVSIKRCVIAADCEGAGGRGRRTCSSKMPEPFFVSCGLSCCPIDGPG